MNQIKNNQSGFTLIELMIVVIIVGILAAVAVPMMSANKSKAMNSEAIASIGAVTTAAKMYIAEYGKKTGMIQLTDINSQGLFNTNDLSGTFFPTANDYSDWQISGTNGRVISCKATDVDNTDWTFKWSDTTHSYQSTK